MPIKPKRRWRSMRGVMVAGLLLCTVLAGCSDGGAGPGARPGLGDTGDSGGAPDFQALRFVDENRSAVDEELTVDVAPQDACLPAGCAAYSATGGDDPAFIKFIDITPYLPVGMHAFVDADATWDKTNPVTLNARMNLQWWSYATTWTSGVSSDVDNGEAHWAGHVSNFGPDPAQLILVVLEPEGLHETVEVTVRLRVTPLDEALAPTHVAAVDLGGGAVPIRVDAKDPRGDMDGQAGGAVQVQVRGPDDALVLAQEVSAGDNVTLPPSSPAGEYLLTAFESATPVGFSVPAANLTTPRMRLVDIGAAPGGPQDLPNAEEIQWTVDYPTTPYWVAMYFDALDGRSTTARGVQVTVTAPDGTDVLSGTFTCQGCVYSIYTFGGSLADPAYTAGTYTFTVSSEAAQGWQVYEVASLYRR